MRTKLNLITEIARTDGKCKFNNLVHLLNVENFKECFRELKKGKASGIDGVTLQEYEQGLDNNLEDLVARMKRFSYKPQPVRRVYIPKANGKKRPLGIPAVEDKIVQMGIVKILQAIFEVDFLDFSYGFRPNRNCHQALETLDKMIMQRPVNHVIDADIKGFFDNVDHGWLMRCIEQRISDKNLLRLLKRFLKAGIVEEGKYISTEKGTPQGGIISPVLANIYLHYVLDLWFERVEKQKFGSYIGMARYCDDFVICVQGKEVAKQLLSELSDRLAKFGLELSAEKTRIVEFGRYARENSRKKGCKPGSFSFLGFTHFCDKGRKGYFKVGRKTDRKKFSVKIKDMNAWLKAVRNTGKPEAWWSTLAAKLRGHFQYYGVSGNYMGISYFRYLTIRLIFKWLNRRSQKKSYNWEQFRMYLLRHPLPKPKIYHNLYTLYGC
jgi:RNA-directed DNA polymerase